jgi:hypothetical protein
MDKSMMKYVNDLKKNCTLSNTDMSVTDNPFYISDKSNKFELQSEICKHSNFLEIIPTKLKVLYNCIGSTREVTFKSKFTLFSLDQVNEKNDTYDTFIDIGLTYMGMGHVIILSMDKKEQLFFFRHDGGSNGYEVEERFNTFKSFTISSYEDKTKVKTFDEILELLMDESTDIHSYLIKI